MFFRKTIRQTRERKIAPDVTVTPAPSVIDMAYSSHTSDEERSKTELRQQMYERIAQGNALAEAEEYSRRMWTSR